MKLHHSLLLSALTLGLAANIRAQEIKLNVPGNAPAEAQTAPAPAMAPVAPVAPAAPTYSEAQILESLGWYMGAQTGLSSFEFTPAQMTALVQGVQLAAQGKDAPVELQKIGPAIQEYVQGKQLKWVAKLKKQSEAESLAFFAKLKTNKNVVELPSGLRYEVIKQGEGPAPTATDTVKVHYTGTLVNGTVFDSSREPRQPGAPVTPVEFVLNEVIPGWTEGIQRINQGGQIRLYIPADLAYGEQGRPGIPPASALVFDVELLEVKATPAPAPAPVAPIAPATK